MKIKLKKALKLNKEEITKLQESQLATVKGGLGSLDESSSGPNCTCKSGGTCSSDSPSVPE
jgi:natural product precursor